MITKTINKNLNKVWFNGGGGSEAIENALKRIEILNDSDKKSVLEEYKEWIKDGLSNHTVLLLRDDPII